MKIGIITFQRAHNFGAQMQMYALSTFLKQFGHDVWILDYHCRSVEDVYYYETPRINRYIRKNIFLSIKQLIKDIHDRYNHYEVFRDERMNSYDVFLHENFKLTYRFDYPEDLPIDFDVLISGSDQIWSYKHTKGRREPYFLDNRKNNMVFPRCISYASSAEKFSYPLILADRDYIKATLQKFEKVSVRETSLAIFLKTNMHIQSDIVLDPSLLLTREDYLKIAIRPKKEHYLCVYRVNRTSYLHKLAKKISKERNLELVEIFAIGGVATCKEESYGPRETLGMLCYADIIITSSFHGTVFSIINRKDFYTVNDKPSVRVNDLLHTFHLDDRALSSYRDYKGFSSTQYDEKLIIDYIQYSKTWLTNAVND